MGNNIIRNLHKAFLIGIILLLLSSAASLITISQLNKGAEWVQHTEKVLGELELLISSMKDAETGVRGYLITGDPETLEPYTHSYTTTLSTFKDLKFLTRDNPEQQQALSNIRIIIDQRYKLLEQQILLKNGGTPVNVYRIKEGKMVMDAARQVVTKMKEHELRLLDKRSHRWITLSTLTPFIIVLITLISAVVSYYFCAKLKVAFFTNRKLHQSIQSKKIEMENRIGIIAEMADKLSSGDYSVRLLDKQKDILGSVAFNLNEMAVSLDYSFNALRELMIKKDEFISFAAHELKTPITSIKAYLQFIARIKLESEEGRRVEQLVNKASEQVNRLTLIINDLLDVTRMNEGQLRLSKTTFKIAEVINEVSAEISTALSNHIFEFAGEGELEITADKTRIKQVLKNIITNSAKYSSAGKKIILSAVQLPGTIKVSVEDFGIGIPQDKIPLVFERYFRVEASSQQYGGMGLGLFISKEIIEKHEGQIGVTSIEGEGTTFWFTLPATGS